MTSKADNEKIAEAMKAQAEARRSRRRTVRGPSPVQVDHDAGTPKGERPLGKPKARQARVLKDPVANAKLIRMRAKWSAQREEVRAARVEESKGEQSPEAVAAREKVARAWEAERVAYAKYQTLLSDRKAAKAASSTAETAEGEAG